MVGCSSEEENINSDESNVTIPVKAKINKLKPLDKNITDKNITKVKKKIIERKEFLLNDLNDNNHTIKIDNKNINISNVKSSLVLLNFFSTWCQPCKGEIPYLVDLAKKYKNKLFIAGIVVNDSIDDSNLTQYVKELNINYYVSNAKDNDEFMKVFAKKIELKNDFIVPLLVLFKDGEYYTHYEGAVPVEMLEYDIKKAIKKGKVK